MEQTFSLLTLFKLGGFCMWPLLVFSVITTAIILERIIYISWHNLRTSDIQVAIERYLAEGRKEEAIVWLSGLSTRRMVAPIFRCMLEDAPLGERRMEVAAEAEASVRIDKLERGFNFLVALGSLGPLTGFLGTVTGMIGAFKSIAEASEVNAQIVASGIFEALITTVFGLIIAIVAIVGHNILSHLVDTFVARLEKSASDIVSCVARIEAKGANPGTA